MSEKKRLVSWTGGIVLLLTVAGIACGPGTAPTPTPTKSPAPAAPTPAAARPSPAPQASPAAKSAVVRFGSPSAVGDAGIYVAIEKGYFKEMGLDAQAINFPSVAETVAPLAAGELEVAGGVINTGLLNAIDRGVALKTVATKGSNLKGFDFTRLTVRKDLIDSGQVKEIKDLKGRRLAVATARAGPEANIAYLLKQGGLSIKDVDLVVMTFPDMVTAFANKAIDAAVHPEPTITSAVERGLAVRWSLGATSAIYGGEYQAGLLFFSEPFSKNADAPRRFMVAYLKGLRDYNDAFTKNKDRAAVVAMLAKYTPVKDAALYDKMEMPYLHPDGKMNVASLKMDLDYFKEMGYYTGKLELQQIIDTQFVDNAAQQLGPYR